MIFESHLIFHTQVCFLKETSQMFSLLQITPPPQKKKILLGIRDINIPEIFKIHF